MKFHQFLIIWAELYVAICHISPPPPSLGTGVSKTDREVVTALERKGKSGYSTRREGWSCEA
jgi:hypothetical protein